MADGKAIAGQAFNCYDRYIAELEVARIAKELTKGTSSIADLNRDQSIRSPQGRFKPSV